MQLREQSPTYRLVTRLLRPLMVLVTRRDWRGAGQLPTSGGLVVCANHLSHLDPLTLAHFLLDAGRPPYFLAKEELFGTPLVGTVLRRATGCPAVPVAQWGPQAILFPYGKRPRLFPRRTVHVLAGPPVQLDDVRGRPIDAGLLQDATRRIMRDVTGLLEQLRGEAAPHSPPDAPGRDPADARDGAP